MKKIFSIFLSIFLIASLTFAYTPLTRIRNFVNDKNNGIPITASYMDAEFNQLITAVNSNGIVQGLPPSSPTTGELWFDTTNNVLKVFRFNEWVQMNPVHAGTVMATPQSNDLWINVANNMNHLKMFDKNISGGNWEDIPALKSLQTGDMPWYNGANWSNIGLIQTATRYLSNYNPNFGTINGVNWPAWSEVTPKNGINWTDLTGEAAGNFLQSNGTGNSPQWSTVAFVPTNIQVFTSTGVWTKPSNISQVYVKVIGAGGNGANGTDGGGGGGGGGYAEGIISVNGNVTVTIGTTNSFAGVTTISATTGSNGTTNASGGVGGIGSNGTINIPGQQGGPSSGAASAQVGNVGGNSVIGVGGAAQQGNNVAGHAGGAYGGGGGGAGFNTSGGTTGGSGDVGAVIVYY